MFYLTGTLTVMACMPKEGAFRPSERPLESTLCQEKEVAAASLVRASPIYDLSLGIKIYLSWSGLVGDMLLLDRNPGTADQVVELWLCTKSGDQNQRALWQKVQLGPKVPGSQP